MRKGYNRFEAIMAYEQGDLDQEGSLELFSDLIQSGLAWTLQGHYGRTAVRLIEGGWIDRAGVILEQAQ